MRHKKKWKERVAMSKQVVNAVRCDAPFSTETGDLFPHFLKLNDGLEGFVFKKSANAIDVGYEGVFEVKKQNKNGENILREIKDFVAGGGGFKPKKQAGSNASFALSYAKDFVIALVDQGKILHPTYQDVLTNADAFKKWLDNNG